MPGLSKNILFSSPVISKSIAVQTANLPGMTRAIQGLTFNSKKC
jgi:hypothetical protein